MCDDYSITGAIAQFPTPNCGHEYSPIFFWVGNCEIVPYNHALTLTSVLCIILHLSIHTMTCSAPCVDTCL